MKVKISAILIAFLLALCPTGFALEGTVTAGDTTTTDFVTEDVQAHSTLGGIVSAVISIIERFVMFGETTVFSDTGGSSEVMDFELYAFESGSEVDMNSLTTGALYQTSEIVDVRGVNASWDTYEAESLIDGPDEQIMHGIGPGNPTGPVEFDDGITGSISSESLTPESTTLSHWYHVTQYHSRPILECDASCPTTEDVLSVYGGTTVDAIKMFEWDSTGEYGYIVWIDGVVGMIADLNRDGVMELTTDNSGYTVDANAGQSLMLLPAGVYDLYAVY